MKRWLKFNAVGLVGMAVHFGLLWLLIRLGMHYLWATGLSIEAAIVQKFWWHLKWTWADRQVTGRSAVTAFLRFNLANALVLFVGNMLSVWLLTEFWHVNPILANLASLPCGIANFFLTDRLVFPQTRSSQKLPKHTEVKMKTKLMMRSLRNVVSRKHPYFAHLAFTHRCNLHCSFCHIPEERVPEQDTAGMKRIIDRLDRMGVAYLSISGGGEPLLRKDFAEILNYAADKGLFVKITSNGTMPREKYAELLASRVSEIGISLDGVRGNQLPYGHVGPKLLDSIRFLNDNLPKNKSLVLNITISQSNVDQVDDIVEYCTREFPRARLWLNPVVVGEGKLRVASEQKVNPEFMRRVQSPTLLNPKIYKDGCEDYYRSETYNWGCLAGELFFDIKPNGDFWICQDHPAKTPLNILSDDFEQKYRQADFSNRRDCSGCTYSCYWMVQKSFEPRTWPALGEMWWKSNTNPGDPWRMTERKKGPLAGFVHYCSAKLFGNRIPASGPTSAQLDLVK